MPSSFKLMFTPIANDDLEEIYQYISEHLSAPQTANDLMGNIETSIMRLENFPYSGSPVADDFLNSRGYRKLNIKNYIVFHLINEAKKQVVIMRVLHSAQKYEDIL